MSKGNGEGLPLVAFRLSPAMKFPHDEFAIAHALRERGWVVPAYTMAPHSEKLKLMRVVVREDFSRSRCDALITDLLLALKTLKDTDPEFMKKHTEHMKQSRNKTSSHRHKLKRGISKDGHSLQAKHGKTHAIC